MLEQPDIDVDMIQNEITPTRIEASTPTEGDVLIVNGKFAAGRPTEGRFDQPVVGIPLNSSDMS